MYVATASVRHDLHTSRVVRWTRGIEQRAWIGKPPPAYLCIFQATSARRTGTCLRRKRGWYLPPSPKLPRFLKYPRRPPRRRRTAARRDTAPPPRPVIGKEKGQSRVYCIGRFMYSGQTVGRNRAEQCVCAVCRILPFNDGRVLKEGP